MSKRHREGRFSISHLSKADRIFISLMLLTLLFLIGGMAQMLWTAEDVNPVPGVIGLGAGILTFGMLYRARNAGTTNARFAPLLAVIGGSVIAAALPFFSQLDVSWQLGGLALVLSFLLSVLVAVLRKLHQIRFDPRE